MWVAECHAYSQSLRRHRGMDLQSCINILLVGLASVRTTQPHMAQAVKYTIRMYRVNNIALVRFGANNGSNKYFSNLCDHFWKTFNKWLYSNNAFSTLISMHSLFQRIVSGKVLGMLGHFWLPRFLSLLSEFLTMTGSFPIFGLFTNSTGSWFTICRSWALRHASEPMAWI